MSAIGPAWTFAEAHACLTVPPVEALTLKKPLADEELLAPERA